MTKAEKRKKMEAALNKITSNKYIIMFNQNLRGNKDEDIINSISVLNAYTISLEYSKENGVEKDAEEIIEFYHWFIDKYGNKEELFQKMLKNWGDDPRIFRIAIFYEKENETAALKEIYDTLSQNEKDSVNGFIENIWKIRKDKILFLLYDSNEEFEQIMEMPKTLPKSEHDDAKKWIKYHVGYGVKTEAIGIFKYLDGDVTYTTVVALSPGGVIPLNSDMSSTIVSDLKERGFEITFPTSKSEKIFTLE